MGVGRLGSARGHWVATGRRVRAQWGSSPGAKAVKADTAKCLGLLSTRLAPWCHLVGSALHNRQGAALTWNAFVTSA